MGLGAAEQGEVKKELSLLNDLIGATQLSLNNQMHLREMIEGYQEAQKRYLKDEDNVELLYQMAKQAHLILEFIKEHHLAQAFDNSFLSELGIVSKPASKRGIPKP